MDEVGEDGAASLEEDVLGLVNRVVNVLNEADDVVVAASACAAELEVDELVTDGESELEATGELGINEELSEGLIELEVTEALIEGEILELANELVASSGDARLELLLNVALLVLVERSAGSTAKDVAAVDELEDMDVLVGTASVLLALGDGTVLVSTGGDGLELIEPSCGVLEAVMLLVMNPCASIVSVLAELEVATPEKLDSDDDKVTAEELLEASALDSDRLGVLVGSGDNVADAGETELDDTSVVKEPTSVETVLDVPAVNLVSLEVVSIRLLEPSESVSLLVVDSSAGSTIIEAVVVTIDELALVSIIAAGSVPDGDESEVDSELAVIVALCDGDGSPAVIVDESNNVVVLLKPRSKLVLVNNKLSVVELWLGPSSVVLGEGIVPRDSTNVVTVMLDSSVVLNGDKLIEVIVESDSSWVVLDKELLLKGSVTVVSMMLELFSPSIVSEEK
ncbi:uncharacterized protein HMPREF1541_00407 [Cyphellophora europaea CBS 101466]|uniref:Uncharacterized protein n=1 Tax=Cyphellophora europaea (strain CBS 101466) TaxID=1220924 RepID=W2SDU6_CYPE1|nr:uncharacterized protein HMPREF1541_00407 [Cyphellophora europaea CBS 101466]ETN46223.1 hypothetical protein HMPREF1541_00407 [Cyphellophora europaea CBS 101466]